MYKLYNSIVNKNIKKEIAEAQWCENLFQYATIKNKIDGLIAAGFLLCPEIVVLEDYIFLSQFWNYHDEKSSLKALKELELQYNYNKKNIEMSVNTWSIGDFFVGDDTELMNNSDILYQFGNMLVYFWSQRLNSLFPDKRIIVEIGNDLMGEYGLCITMYEDS